MHYMSTLYVYIICNYALYMHYIYPRIRYTLYTVDSLLCIYTLMYALCKHRDAIALYIISN